MSDIRFEELGAANALGLLSPGEVADLNRAAAEDPQLAALIRGYEETAAMLALSAPLAVPPETLRAEILRKVEAAHPPQPVANVIPIFAWLPYALAACLMGLVIFQAREIFRLNREVGAGVAETHALRQQQEQMPAVRFAALAAKDPGHAGANVLVAWNPHTNSGLITTSNLAPPPAGSSYQLWVLDPSVSAPINAGVMGALDSPRNFTVGPVRAAHPGFAISLERAGGSPLPAGPILFAVAPGE